MAPASVAKAEASRMEHGVHNRLKHVDHCRLHDAIPHGRNSQRALRRPVGFGNPPPPHRCRTIGSVTQFGLQPIEFRPLMLGELRTRLPVNARSPVLAQDLLGRAGQVQAARHLIPQRVPFASSHFVCHQCRHHAICPNRSMSPLVDPRKLPSRGSRKRHCDWDVISTRGRGSTCRRFSHFTSTFLLPFAPPRYAARLPSYYESSDFCRAASSNVIGIASFVPLRHAIRHRGAWAIDHAASPTANGHDTSSTSFTRQISLLSSFDLPTIPSPTTTLPFRHGRFPTLRHRRDLPRLSPGQTLRSKGSAVARSRVRTSLGASPTGLAESSSRSLRTGRSSQIALHPSSRKRSYHCRLQAGNVRLRGTCTLLIKRLHRRTRCSISCCLFLASEPLGPWEEGTIRSCSDTRKNAHRKQRHGQETPWGQNWMAVG